MALAGAGALLHLNGNRIVQFPYRPANPTRLSPSSYNKAMMVMNQSYWDSIHADVETHLREAIHVRPPLSVYEPMHHLALDTPQNTAPALCAAACELVGGHRDQAMAAAAALHLMHAATYTHGHLPLTDRSKPMITHHAYGPNIELLMGDAIIPFGFELLSMSDDSARDISDRVLRVIIEIARVTGSQGIISGQYHEIQYDESKNNHDLELIKRISEKKEGELHACGAKCGAILGGGNEDEVEKLRKFGFYVGMVKGMLHRGDKSDEILMREVEELKSLALDQLTGFNATKVEAFATLVGS